MEKGKIISQPPVIAMPTESRIKPMSVLWPIAAVVVVGAASFFTTQDPGDDEGIDPEDYKPPEKEKPETPEERAKAIRDIFRTDVSLPDPRKSVTDLIREMLERRSQKKEKPASDESGETDESS